MNVLNPGELIFSDQFESRLPGRVFAHRGSSLKYDVYKGGTIFCDCATNYVKIYNQSSFSECETVLSKINLEKEALRRGNIVRRYRT